MNRVLVIAAACAALLVTVSADAATTPEQKCQTSKLKAQGKLQACLKKQRAAVVLGKADDSAGCHAKFQATLDKIDAKATDAGTSCRIVDNGDGTLTDLDTGLMWEEKTLVMGPHFAGDFYSWANAGMVTIPNGTAFTNLLGALNEEQSADGNTVTTACFAGHCDWRLPTILELETLVDLAAPGCNMGGGAPCVIAGMGETPSFFHLSSTTSSTDPTDVWGVDFEFGTTFASGKSGSGPVKAVRGGF